MGELLLQRLQKVIITTHRLSHIFQGVKFHEWQGNLIIKFNICESLAKILVIKENENSSEFNFRKRGFIREVRKIYIP